MKDFKPGDFITAYHKGIHRVIEVYDLKDGLGGSATQVDYQRVDFRNKTLHPTVKSCSIMYCQPAELFLLDEIEERANQLAYIREVQAREEEEDITCDE